MFRRSLLIFGIFISNLALGQKPFEHQFEVFSGFLPLQGILPEIYLSEADLESNFALEGASQAGFSYGFEYGYFLSPGVALTIHVNYTPFQGEFLNSTSTDLSYLDQQHLAVMMGTQFYYLRTDRSFQLYSSILLGGMGIDQFIRDDLGERRNQIGVVAFQVSPIGLRFGSRFGGSLEIGIGHKGVFSAGLFYRL